MRRKRKRSRKRKRRGKRSRRSKRRRRERNRRNRRRRKKSKVRGIKVWEKYEVMRWMSGCIYEHQSLVDEFKGMWIDR